MRRLSQTIVILVILFLPPLLCAKNIGLGCRILNTQGFGGEITGQIFERLNARIGYNYYKFGFNIDVEDVNLDNELILSSANFLADYFFISDRWRFSAGIILNNNRTEILGAHTDTVLFGGLEIPPDELGNMTVNITFDKLAPYLGIGYGNPVGEGRFAFVFDFGFFFQNSSNVSLKATGLIERTERNAYIIENNLKDFRFMPVISLGVAYRIFEHKLPSLKG
ncbi:MAG: hypothetical protein P9L92_00680 [Candidatus Electryonea clarkiae]|nr:hypothetical protein [Candidatus Electryonea clarkiae]MDP8287093.1 hypothetical protein [Candidatus Electryonea clarkiae]